MPHTSPGSKYRQKVIETDLRVELVAATHAWRQRLLNDVAGDVEVSFCGAKARLTLRVATRSTQQQDDSQGTSLPACATDVPWLSDAQFHVLDTGDWSGPSENE